MGEKKSPYSLVIHNFARMFFDLVGKNVILNGIIIDSLDHIIAMTQFLFITSR